MGLEHLSRLTMLNSTATKQIALYTVEVMTIFVNGSLFSPNISPLPASAVSVHILPYNIFPFSPGFSPVRLDTHGADSGTQLHWAAHQLSECNGQGAIPLSLTAGASLGPFPLHNNASHKICRNGIF